MQAIILVGGLGTRLRSVIHHLPKPMAPIQNKPFLAYLLDYLQVQGITKVIFPVHFMREKIQDYFQSEYNSLQIDYAIEEEPLGTGGAIVNALSLHNKDEPVFVLNGDTFVKVDYRKVYAEQQKTNAKIMMTLREVEDCERYGKVIVRNEVVTEFREKGERGPGLINAGVYLIDPTLFSRYALTKKFSFEKDFLYPYAGIIQPRAFMANDYFIDIGIPEDYVRASNELPQLEM